MCSSLSSSFAFFDGDFIRHLPRPLLQHHIDEMPRARRLVSVDGNSLSKRRNIIRELGQRNPNADHPTTTLSWLFRGSWWDATGPFFLSQSWKSWMDNFPDPPRTPRPACPIHHPFLCLLERDGLYNTPPLDSMQQMASHQPSHVLKPPPFPHLKQAICCINVMQLMRPEGAATKKWMQPGRGRSIVTTRTTLGLSSAADQRGPWNMKFALQLKNQQATWKQAKQRSSSSS